MIKVMALPLLLLIMTIIGCNTNDSERQSGEETGNTTEVMRSRIVSTIEEEGEIAPSKSVEVKPNISGRITQVLVNEGEFVGEGQKLAEIIADRDQTRSINSIINNYRESEINYKNAKEDYEYAQDLYEHNFIPDREYRNALDSYKIAEMRYYSAKEEYQLALQEIDVTDGEMAKTSSVASPLTGIVLERFIEAGELASGETSTRSGTVLFNIADYTSFVVKVNINEFDIDRVTHGQNVVITRGRTGEERYRGEVFKISPLAVQRDGVRVYPVEIAIDSDNENLRFGMTAAVRIITARADDVLTIPVASLFVNNQGEEYVMLQQEDGSFQEHHVKRGINDTFFVEITDGLEEGDVIITQGDAAIPGRGRRDGGVSLPGMPTQGVGHGRR